MDDFTLLKGNKMKKLLVSMMMLLMFACEETNDNSDVNGIANQTENLTTFYGSRTRTGNGPLAGPVGTEVSQTIVFKCNDHDPCYPPCPMTGYLATSCISSTYFKFYFDATNNPSGYTVVYNWGNPSAGVSGSPLQVLLCAQIKELGTDAVVQDLGCTDVSSTHSGGTNSFATQSPTPWWGDKFPYSSVKGWVPEFKFKYKFLPTQTAPIGTPCNNCLIPVNSVMVYNRQDSLP